MSAVDSAPGLIVGQQVGPGAAVAVTGGRVAAFARALGADVDPDGAAPPTFVVALALDSPGGAADLLWPLVAAGVAGGVVHGDQQLTVHRPVHGGDVLSFSSCVATVRRLPGALMTNIATAVVGADGGPVADLTATFVLPDPALPDPALPDPTQPGPA